jgi:hypothetical protein
MIDLFLRWIATVVAKNASITNKIISPGLDRKNVSPLKLIEK